MKRLAIYPLIACFFSCTTIADLYYPRPSEPSSSIKIWNSKNKPSILLRTPNQRDVVSGSTGINQDRLYTLIEREFIENGYTIRDRGMFEKVLTQNQQMDYSKMRELTNTDIILEITGITTEKYATNKVTKNGKEKLYPYCTFSRDGWKVDMKIIKVKENELASVKTFYKAPCENGCRVEIRGCDARAVGSKPQKPNYKTSAFTTKESDLLAESFAKDIALRIMKELN